MIDPKELEERLKKTLSWHLIRLPDDETRDFMLKLIIRDVIELDKRD